MSYILPAEAYPTKLREITTGKVYRSGRGHVQTIIGYDETERLTPFRSASGQWFSRAGIHYGSGDDRSNDLVSFLGKAK